MSKRFSYVAPLILFAVASCAANQSSEPKSARIGDYVISSTGSYVTFSGKQSDCDCLKEKQDLWLCGMADEPTPSYDSSYRDEISRILVQGAMTGVCAEEEKAEGESD